VKTISLKKVSAVAVASLGFGLLSVVPAQATPLTANQCTALTATPFYAVTATGTAVTNVVTITTEAGEVDDKCVVTATLAVKPTGSTAAATLTVGTAANANYTLTQLTSNSVRLTKAGTPASQTGQAFGSLSFTPDVPGEYRIVLTPVITVAAGTVLTASTGLGHLGVYATGTGATVASSGIGTTTVQGVSGGQATINFVPVVNATADIAAGADQIWTVTSSGVGAITRTTGEFYALPSSAATAGIGTRTATNGSITSAGTGFNAPTNGTDGDYSAGARLGNGSTLKAFTFNIQTSSSVAGVQTLVISSISAATGAPTAVSTVTITWSATAAAASAAFSTSFVTAGTTCGVADATSGLNFSRTAGTVANICITVKDSNGNAMVGQALTATIAGPGLIALTSGHASTSAGTVRAASLTATDQASASTAKIVINSDGTSGTTVVTISNGSTVLATETITFYGTVATLTATQNLKVARASTTGAELGTSSGAGDADDATTAALTPAVVIVAKDSAGVVVPSLTITGLSSDATVISTATVLEAVGADDTTGEAGPGTYLASVTSAGNGTSGKSATVTFRTQLSTGAYISAAPLTFTLGGSVSTETISFDKTAYASGEAMTVTVTAKDSAGNAVYDGLTSPTLTASKAIGGALPSGFYVGGVVKNSANKLFAPAIGGSFAVNGTSSNTAKSAITASATVADANAAIATSIASLNAKIVALNALIAKIMKRLNIR
jgi:hypothetical protein